MTPKFNENQQVKARNHKGYGKIVAIYNSRYDGKNHYRYDVRFENGLSASIKTYCEFELKEVK